MDKRTVRDVEVSGRRVLVRVDFNVPLDDCGRVADDRRIRESLPTVRYLLEHGAAVVLMSHLGRPGGRVVEELRMAPVGERLGQLLGQPVRVLPDCVGPQVEALIGQLRPGDVALLENLRFHPGEEANDPAFAAALARLADLYVNDAFGTAHRAHASTVGVARLLPAVAGLLMEKEIRYLSRLLENPDHPFVAVLGGRKVSDKMGVLANLLQRVDAVLIGGGMAYTFLRARGLSVGRSVVEEDKVELAERLMEQARQRGVELLLPEDVAVAQRPAADVPRRVVLVREIPEGWMGLDVGPATVQRFAQVVERARLVVWNGPMGVFEVEPFAEGTRRLAEVVARCPGTTVVGGGDTAAALEQLGMLDRFDHVSTGGGATLEFLEGKELPGIRVLQDR
ncbi:MAG: phosphoglycerate kinase [candidate division GAL15 bacterium]